MGPHVPSVLAMIGKPPAGVKSLEVCLDVGAGGIVY